MSAPATDAAPVVMKFGGSSLRTEERIAHAAGLVAAVAVLLYAARVLRERGDAT